MSRSHAALALLAPLLLLGCQSAPDRAVTAELPPRLTPFLMFEGDAEEAMTLYLEAFEHARIVTLERYGEGEIGPAGTVEQAVFEVGGRSLRFFDSPIRHPFGFTPAVSLYVAFSSADELDRAFAKLSEGGEILMPLDAYPFSPRYAWISDRFGVSWQLALEPAPSS